MRAWGQMLDEMAMIVLSYDALRDVVNIKKNLCNSNFDFVCFVA